MEIKVYATLRNIVGGKTVDIGNETVEMTVAQIIEKLFTQYPALEDELTTRTGEYHSAFHFLINGRDARFLQGPETVVTAKDEVRIFPPVGGGL